jgi:DNA-binding GntR family transcriptional regulator
MVRLRKISSRPSRLADQVYGRLMGAILSGAIGQGDRLVQEQLAADLAVSRTPVREALQRLEREGVLEQAGRRGYQVRTISEGMIRAIYQAREAVEGYAARLVADTASPQALELLARRLADFGTTANLESAYEANRMAHRAIVEATGNDYLVDLFDAIWGRAIALRIYADLWAAENIHRSIAESHAELLAALRTGDGDRAARVMVEHIRLGIEQQLEALKATG